MPDMAEARTYYEYEYSNGLTWWFIREEIGRGLRERFQVPEELPPKLLALVKKLAALESNRPRSRTLVGKLDVIEGGYLLRYAPPVEPRSVGPSDDWPLCT
jgi:hypothetical protein